MSGVGTGQNAVNGAPAQPPRYGLLVAAPVSSTPPYVGPNFNGSWANGIRWNPEACGVSGRAQLLCAGDTASLVTHRSGTMVGSDPFVIYGSDVCSPFGFQARDWSGRAIRALEATQSYEIANELWTGELKLAGDDGGFLTDHTTLDYSFTLTNTDKAQLVIQALGCLEQGLANCNKGRRGMIHVTPQVLTQLKAAFAIDLVGSQMLTGLGNIVVADAGYDGSGPGGQPAGATQWMYATDMINIVLSAQPALYPGDLATAQAMAEALERSQNTVTVVAEKLALYQWDRCCHVGVEIDLPVCVVSS